MTHDALRKRVAMAIWQATPDISSSAASIAADAAIPVVAEAMREAISEAVYAEGWYGEPLHIRARVLSAIANTPIPSASALAERDERMREEGRREEREACAQEADCGCAARADVLARLATDGEKRASYLCVHGDVCCALQAAAIRALPLPGDET